MRRTAALLFASLLLTACSGTTASLQSPAAPGTPTSQAPAAAPTSSAAAPPATATERPTDEPSVPTDTPATAPSEGPTQYRPGDAIVLTSNGADWARITVSKVKSVASYTAAYYTDRPKVKGHVFIQAYISYEALANGVDYNPLDWQVFANGEAVDGYAFVMNGPEPQLHAGTLPKGRKAAGWVVYEVPAKGEVLLSYQENMFSNDAPVFEVKLR